MANGVTPEKLAVRRFTVEEYHRMAETGILSADERVELVRGVVRQMSPKHRAHVIAVDHVASLLRDALKGRASVYQEAPLVVERVDSEPEPDVMVCSNPDRSAYGTSRTSVLLVVEVADSSLEYDLRENASLYAEAGVPEYWVVDLVHRTLVVFREPASGNYERWEFVDEGVHLTHRAWPGVSWEVSALLAWET